MWREGREAGLFWPIAAQPPKHQLNSLGPAFGRTDFSRIFVFEPPDFLADFLAGFFLLIFVGKSAQKNPPGKPRENPPNFIQQKSSNTFLQIGRGKNSENFTFLVLKWPFGTTEMRGVMFDGFPQDFSFLF